MINLLGLGRVEIPSIIQAEVDKIHHTNYLFGSRRMADYYGYSHKAAESDWDFAFPYEGSEYTEVRKAEGLGWTQKPCEKYKDEMHFITWEKMIDGHKVQMCSKINYSLFKETFEDVDPSFYWKYLHKSSVDCLPKKVQNDIFNQFYKMKGW